MTFKSAEFLAAPFQPRMASLPVPGMADWFDGDAVWHCRGLTLSEVNFAEVMAQGHRQKLRLSANQPMQELPISTALKIEYVALASIPSIDYDIAFKLSEVFPVEFNQIFLKIADLTGEGQQNG